MLLLPFSPVQKAPILPHCLEQMNSDPSKAASFELDENETNFKMEDQKRRGGEEAAVLTC